MDKTKVQFILDGVHSKLQSELLHTEIFGAGEEHYVSNEISFEQSLNPGVYRARVRSGAQSEDSLVVVESKATQQISLTAPTRFSSAPLPDVVGTHEYYSGPFMDRSVTRGSLTATTPESAPFLFIYIRMRDIKHAESYRQRHQKTPELFAGLKLLDTQGNLLTRFDSSEIDQKPEVGMARFRAKIAPGYYRLVYTTDENRRQWLPIHVLPPTHFDWDTDITLIWHNRPIFSSISLFTPISNGSDQLYYNQYVMEVSAADAVTQTLASGRRLDNLKSQTVKQLLNDKFSNPMTGIMGLHLYLLSGRAKPDSVEYILNNLRNLAPESPDVEALHFIAAELGLITPPDTWYFRDIPMLRLSAVAMHRAFLSVDMQDKELPPHAEQLFLHLESGSPWTQTGCVQQPPLESKRSRKFDIKYLNLASSFIAEINHNPFDQHQKIGTLGQLMGNYVLYKGLEKLIPMSTNKQKPEDGLPVWLIEAVVKRAEEIEEAREEGSFDEYLKDMAEQYEVMLPTLHKIMGLLPKKKLTAR